MTNRKHRVNLTLKTDMNSLLDDLAELTGVPKARLVADFLDEAEPALKTMRKALRTANNSREKLPYALAELVADANVKTAIMNQEMAEIFSKQANWEDNDD